MNEKLDQETTRKIQEMQLIEQNMQNMLLQKQQFQMELNETINADEEIKKTKSDVYKIVGQIMVKTNKKDMEEELNKKKEIIELRIKSIEKQEKFLSEQLSKNREEILKKINQK
jgi:prefoldin beta subunit